MSVASQRHRFQPPDFMKPLLLSERYKWIFVIGIVAIAAGFTAKNVISYPTECMPGSPSEVSPLQKN